MGPFAPGFDAANDRLVLEGLIDDDLLYDNLILKLPPNIELSAVVTPGGTELWELGPVKSAQHRGLYPSEAYVRIRAWQASKTESYLESRQIIVQSVHPLMTIRDVFGKQLKSGHLDPQNVRFPATATDNQISAALLTIYGAHSVWRATIWTPQGPIRYADSAASLDHAIKFWRSMADEEVKAATFIEVEPPGKSINVRYEAMIFGCTPMKYMTVQLKHLPDNAPTYGLVLFNQYGSTYIMENATPAAIQGAIQGYVAGLTKPQRQLVCFWVAPTEWPLMKALREKAGMKQTKATKTMAALVDEAEAESGKITTSQKMHGMTGKDNALTFEPAKKGELGAVVVFDEESGVLAEMLGGEPSKVLGQMAKNLKEVVLANKNFPLLMMPPGVKVKLEDVGPKGVPITSLPKLAAKSQPDKFKGKLFCLTGTLSADRDKMASLIEYLGGKFKNSVTGNTNILVIGTKPGITKVASANKLGVTIWTEMDFWNAVPEGVRQQFFVENGLGMVMQMKPLTGAMVKGEISTSQPEQPSKVKPAKGRKVVLD